jgi:hypothetical protein
MIRARPSGSIAITLPIARMYAANVMSASFMAMPLIPSPSGTGTMYWPGCASRTLTGTWPANAMRSAC